MRSDKITNKSPVNIILDTDIGPDCDDAGALAILHCLRLQNEVNILAVMHCTSSPWGAGCVDAINTYYGCGNIPVGSLNRKGFLDDDENFHKYDRYIALNYPNKYKDQNASDSVRAEDAVRLYRKLLSKNADKDITIVAIGPLKNINDLLISGSDDISDMPGIELVRNKVVQLIIMGGCFLEDNNDPGFIEAEWNIQMDIASAVTVADLWPTPIDFCGFEIGFKIITGSILLKASSNDPVKKAYELHTPGMKRPSWDPATVLYSVRGSGYRWDTSCFGQVTIDETGKTKWEANAYGNHRYLISKGNTLSIQNELSGLMVNKPVLL